MTNNWSLVLSPFYLRFHHGERTITIVLAFLQMIDICQYYGEISHPNLSDKKNPG